MEAIFMHEGLDKSVKVSGDFVTTGAVCPFSSQLHRKTATGSFLPSCINLCKNN